MKVKELRQITHGMPASDGAGVKLTRLIGHHEIDMLDPFLMLDSFESDQAQDYLAGFPPHPHRGFETVTYMLAGKMRHKDSAGNEGLIKPNGVQWMTAGKGIVHSEMPEQESGLMQGFQLWVNLPSSEKMTEPKYQEFPEENIRTEVRSQGQEISVIAGKTDLGTQGVVHNSFVHPTYLDIKLPSTTSFSQTLNASDNTFIYVIDGCINLGEQKRRLTAKQLGILTQGELVKVTAEKPSRLLLVSGMPLNEPVAKGGPFVMNTHQEVMQAFEDYQNNQFIS